jgi:hypothetical protein
MDSRLSPTVRRDRRWQEVLLLLLVLLMGFLAIRSAADRAVRPQRSWLIAASMRSELNPDLGTPPSPIAIEPLRPEVLTPAVWEQVPYLTPPPQATVVPPVVFQPISTPTFASTPSSPATLTSVSTPLPVSRTPTPTPTPSTPTRTPTPTPTSTRTPTPAPSRTPTPTPTPLPTFTPTYTPVPPTSTPTPWPTATPAPPTLPPRPTQPPPPTRPPLP